MSPDMAAGKIVEAIREMLSKEPEDNLLFGTIESVSPLKVRLNDKIVLNENMLILGHALKPIKVKMPHSHEYSGKVEMTKAVSGPFQEDEYTKTTYDDKTGKEISTPVTVPEGGAEIQFEGEGTLTIVEAEGHCHVIKKQTTDNVHKSGTKYSDYVTIEIEPKLSAGDRVILFAFNNFRKFYIAERIEDEEEGIGI